MTDVLEPLALTVHPATPDRWADLERLFGPKGADAGCWCMWWRLPRQEWKAGAGTGNRLALRALVEDGPPPGLLAYAGDEPAGWVAIGPRRAYPGLDRSRSLKPVDDRPVWSLSCLFVGKPYRRRGVSEALIRAAARYVRGQGVRLLEAYPVAPQTERYPLQWAFTGVASTFTRVGFAEVARRAATRPVLRLSLVEEAEQLTE